jgi:hypothetical protein
MAGGRTTEARSVTVTKTNASTAITGAAGTFSKNDVGRTITGTGIPAGATLAAVASDTAATLSAAATATIGGTTHSVAAAAYGFTGWSPESDAEANAYTVAANNAGTAQPDRITNPYTAAAQRGRG